MSSVTTPHLQHEEQLYAQGYDCVGGVDEAGRGPLAGPVVACAVILPRGCMIDGVRDSKKLSPARRAQLADLICRAAVAWSVGMADETTIDRINILQATLLAMAQAVETLSVAPGALLVDGPHIPIWHEHGQMHEHDHIHGHGHRHEHDHIHGHGHRHEHENIHGHRHDHMYKHGQRPNTIKTIPLPHGDAISHSVAAASIVAKVTRDALMEDIHRQYPCYGFDKHKGYGTPQHIAAIRAHGPCPFHRTTFIKRLV